MSNASKTKAEAQSVLIVGGGLIGLCCAYYLQKRGLNVTVLESESVGGGASRGNLGEIVPSLVTPLSTPGILRESFGSVFKPDSALFVHPQISREMTRFLIRFIRSTRTETFERSVADLQTLASDTFALFDELEADGIALERNIGGFLFLFKTVAAAEASLANQRKMTGVEADLLSGAQARSMEPNVSASIEAGYLLEDLRSLDPSAFVDRLSEKLRAESVQIIEFARATSIRTSKRSVVVSTDNGDFEADMCVVAAGVWSRDLCRTLGADLDLVAGKGYSFNVDLPAPLTRTLQFADAHVVATPMGDQVRIAGTMELDRRREHFSPGRVRSIVAAATPYLDGVDWGAIRNEWVGPRPMTGDGMPIIGPLANEPRVLVATGHNMHGLTLGPVTGRMVADLVADPARGSANNPFDPSLNGRVKRWKHQ